MLSNFPPINHGPLIIESFSHNQKLPPLPGNYVNCLGEYDQVFKGSAWITNALNEKHQVCVVIAVNDLDGFAGVDGFMVAWVSHPKEVKFYDSYFDSIKELSQIEATLFKDFHIIIRRHRAPYELASLRTILHSMYEKEEIPIGSEDGSIIWSEETIISWFIKKPITLDEDNFSSIGKYLDGIVSKAHDKNYEQYFLDEPETQLVSLFIDNLEDPSQSKFGSLTYQRSNNTYVTIMFYDGIKSINICCTSTYAASKLELERLFTVHNLKITQGSMAGGFGKLTEDKIQDEMAEYQRWQQGKHVYHNSVVTSKVKSDAEESVIQFAG